jgi:hypothetical protein
MAMCCCYPQDCMHADGTNHLLHGIDVQELHISSRLYTDGSGDFLALNIESSNRRMIRKFGERTMEHPPMIRYAAGENRQIIAWPL